MRVELRDGMWAELRDVISHGQDKEIRRARAAFAEDPASTAGNVDTTALRVYVKAWSVQDPNGESIPLEAEDAIDRMPSDLADAVITEINKLIKENARPNRRTPPSSADSSSAKR
jgi:hypothetical protein